MNPTIMNPAVAMFGARRTRTPMPSPAQYRDACMQYVIDLPGSADILRATHTVDLTDGVLTITSPEGETVTFQELTQPVQSMHYRIHYSNGQGGDFKVLLPGGQTVAEKLKRIRQQLMSD